MGVCEFVHVHTERACTFALEDGCPACCCRVSYTLPVSVVLQEHIGKMRESRTMRKLSKKKWIFWNPLLGTALRLQ